MIRIGVLVLATALFVAALLSAHGQADRARTAVARRILQTSEGAIPVRIARNRAATAPASLILLLPGWGEDGQRLADLQDALAARGYVVVAMPDIAFFGKDRRQSEEEQSARYAQADLSTVPGIAATRRWGDARIAIATRAASAVLTAVLQDKTLAGAIDAGRIAAVGYSFGGATAVNACIGDRRFGAAANLDGWLFGAGAQESAGCPYLLIFSREAAAPAEKPKAPVGCALEDWRLNDLAAQRRHVAHAGSTVLIAHRTTHHDLGGPFPGMLSALARRPWLDRVDALDRFLSSAFARPAPSPQPGRGGDLAPVTLDELDTPTRCDGAAPHA